MKDLIRVSEKQTVLGRDLYEFLEVKTAYTQWFERMLEWGFEENLDFRTFSQKSENVQNREFGDTTCIKPKINHQLTIGMAKEISMLQRNHKGKEARKYFIDCENRLLNSYKKQLQADINNIDIKEYIKSLPESSITKFINDKLEDSLNTVISSINLCDNYNTYCTDNKLKPVSRGIFLREIRKLLPKDRYSKNCRIDGKRYRGYKNINIS